MEEGLAVVAGRRPKILVDGHPSKLSQSLLGPFNPEIDLTDRILVRISVWQPPALRPQLFSRSPGGLLEGGSTRAQRVNLKSNTNNKFKTVLVLQHMTKRLCDD